jgi:hypothetical protein
VQPGIQHEQRQAKREEMQQRLPRQPAEDRTSQGVYQIGEVKARSCVIMGTFESIFTLK